MSKSLRDSAIAMLEAYRKAPATGTQAELQDTYTGITLEEAQKVKAGLLAVLDAKTEREQAQKLKEYNALHKELRGKYKKSGKP